MYWRQVHALILMVVALLATSALGASGNLTETTDYAYGAPTVAGGGNSNQLMSMTKGGVTSTYSYDGRGNRIGRNDGTPDTYTYDSHNRLTKVSLNNGASVYDFG